MQYTNQNDPGGLHMSCIHKALPIMVLCFFMIGGAGYAQSPRMISYQGVLTDTLGAPKPDGVYNFIFRLHDAPVGGGVVWSETKALPVHRGLFTTMLGDVSSFPDSLRFSRSFWLSIEVAGELLFPRIQLGAVGYAFHSLRADTSLYAFAAVVGTNSVDSTNIKDGAITTSDVKDGAITDAKIANVDARKISTGTIDFNRFPTGGSWNLSSSLDIGGTLVVTPGAKLDVNGNMRIANNQSIAGNSGNGIGYLSIAKVGIGNELTLGDANNAKLQFVTGGTNGAVSMVIANGGNIGVGTATPTEKLHVVGNILATGTITQASSRRWKTNIMPMKKALEKVLRLQGVTFRWKTDGRNDFGLIAEEVAEVIPEAVTFEENHKDAKGVDYGRLVAVLIEAIKEQQTEIQFLKETLAVIQKKQGPQKQVQFSGEIHPGQ
jgi:hypothetical protein